MLRRSAAGAGSAWLSLASTFASRPTTRTMTPSRIAAAGVLLTSWCSHHHASVISESATNFLNTNTNPHPQKVRSDASASSALLTSSLGCDFSQRRSFSSGSASRVPTTTVVVKCMTLPNGDIYEGECVIAKKTEAPAPTTAAAIHEAPSSTTTFIPHGKGKLTRKDAAVGRLVAYEGDFYEGKKHGVGIATFLDTGTYEGEWENDKYHGHGTKKWRNGDLYEGQWKADRRHGIGRYRSVTGTESGQYEDSVLVSGDTTYTAGGHYSGGYNSNDWYSYHGQGTLTNPDGSSYTGDFKSGQKHGSGVEKDSKGNVIFEGYFKDDGAASGTHKLKQGVYTGECSPGKNRRPHGHGEMVFKNGDVFKGTWSKGQHISGRLTYANNGDSYIGTLHKGRRNGKGVLQEARTGTIYTGQWWFGKKHGHGTSRDAEGRIVFAGTWFAGIPLSFSKRG